MRSTGIKKREKIEKENLDFPVTSSLAYWRSSPLSLAITKKEAIHYSCSSQPHAVVGDHLFSLILVPWQMYSRFHIFPSTALAVSHKFWCEVLSLLLNSKYCAMLLTACYVIQNAVANRNHFQIMVRNNWNNALVIALQVYWSLNKVLVIVCKPKD